jgi:hypothetical protein
VAEWSNVPDSKSGVPQGTVGSNPTLSASKSMNKRLSGRFFYSSTNAPASSIGAWALNSAEI